MVNCFKALKKNAVAIVSTGALVISSLTPPCIAPAQARVNVPEAVLKKPVSVVEDSVSTYVPSKCAPGNGIAVNVIFPEKPRYKAGAPIAIVVSGNPSTSLSMSMHAANCGIAEVRFAYPGKGLSRFHSDGIFDNFGDNCSTALKDVALFMKGEINDYKGRSVRELIPVALDQSIIGLVAWETGGNIALVTMAKHHDKIPFINYLAFFEGAVGPLFEPPNLGTVKDMLLNRHYKEGSAATGNILIDYRKLMFSPHSVLHPGVAKKRGDSEIKGVLYFDENKNNAWDETSEFALQYASEVGLESQIYAPPITEALVRLNVFNRSLGDPDAIAKLKEAAAAKKMSGKKEPAKPQPTPAEAEKKAKKEAAAKAKEEKAKEAETKETEKKDTKKTKTSEKSKDSAKTKEAADAKPVLTEEDIARERRKNIEAELQKLTMFNINTHIKMMEENIASTAAYNKSLTAHLKERVKEKFQDRLQELQPDLIKKEFAKHKRLNWLEILQWPHTVATPAISKAYFDARDGSIYVKDVCQSYPNLLVGLFGARVAHTQRQPDHPHVALLYNLFLENKPRWLRLNGEPVYISTICKMNINNFPSNQPNAPLDATNIVEHLAPLGLVPEYAYMDALVAELSDRAKSGNLKFPLPSTLSEYIPIADQSKIKKEEPKDSAGTKQDKGDSGNKEAAGH